MAIPFKLALIFVGPVLKLAEVAKSTRTRRPAEMRKVQGLCPRNEIDRCLCHDKKVANFPFDLRTFYFECRPTKVREPPYESRPGLPYPSPLLSVRHAKPSRFPPYFFGKKRTVRTQPRYPVETGNVEKV